MSKKDVLAEALRVLVDGGIEDVVVEKLRNEIAAIEREEADELVVEYYEFMKNDQSVPWDDLSVSLKETWRNSYGKNKKFWAEKLGTSGKAPDVVRSFDELKSWPEHEWTDAEGDTWKYDAASYQWCFIGTDRNHYEQNRLSAYDADRYFPMVRVVG